jgi:hypothetical protein
MRCPICSHGSRKSMVQICVACNSRNGLSSWRACVWESTVRPGRNVLCLESGKDGPIPKKRRQSLISQITIISPAKGKSIHTGCQASRLWQVLCDRLHTRKQHYPTVIQRKNTTTPVDTMDIEKSYASFWLNSICNGRRGPKCSKGTYGAANRPSIFRSIS